LDGASILAASWAGHLMRWRPEGVAQTPEFRRRGWQEYHQNLEYPRAAPLEKKTRRRKRCAEYWWEIEPEPASASLWLLDSPI
jgi:hypothetical protein